MSARNRETRSNLFIVRVWPEEIHDGGVEWRGKVQSVVSGETLFFRDWNVMLAFIRDSSQQQMGKVDGRIGYGEEGEK